MLKCCRNALKVTCALALVGALSPATAFAQLQDSAQQNNDALASAQEATASETVETEIDSSKLQKTDVSKLAQVDEGAAEAVEGYIEDRADEVTGDASASDDDSLDLSKKVAKTSDERADGFQQMQDDANISITDASTTVTVSKVTATGSKVTVEAYEETVFHYDDLSDGKGGSDVALFGTDHTFTIDTSGEQATIKSDSFDESDLNGIDTAGTSTSAASGSTTEAAESAADQQAAQTEDAGASVLDAVLSLLSPEKAYAASTSYDSDYNPQEAIAYADKYWSNYNTKYRNFNPDGGDCANFVSQCLKAGNLDQKKSGSSAWYYTSASNYSESWTYCPTMVKALKSRGKYYWISKAKLSTKASAKKIYPGSPVIYNSADSESSTGSYYHAVICTGYNSAGTPVISAHNNNRYHVPYTYAGSACATIQLTETAPGTTYTTTVSTAMSTGAVETSTFSWTLNSDKKTATITKYTGTGTSVTIPETVSKKENGTAYTVTGIGPSAFKGATKLQTVKGLDKITSIGSYAFQGCTALKSVALSSSLSSIGKYAFKGCTKLTKVTGATGVTTIGSRAFDGDKKLKNIASLKNATSIGSYAFRSCKALASLPAFAKVTKIGSYAFKNCDALVTVSGFGALKTLGKGAFYGCGKLQKVSVGSAVLKSIGAYAFWKTLELESVDFASPKLAKIGDWAFYMDGKLNTLKFGTALLTVDTVGYSSFTCTGESPTVYVPSSVRKTYKSKKVFSTHGLSTAAKYLKY